MGNHTVILKQVERLIKGIVYHQKSQTILKYNSPIGLNTQDLKKKIYSNQAVLVFK